MQMLLRFSILLLAACAAYGQAGFGTIAGRVLDPSGAVVPSANIELTNTATQEVSRAAH
jgi:hypothetical protein